MITKDRTRPAGNGTGPDDHHGGGITAECSPATRNTADSLNLPPIPERVAEILADTDPAQLRRVVRQMDYTRRTQWACVAAGDRLHGLLSADPAVILETIRDEFRHIAELAKVAIGDE